MIVLLSGGVDSAVVLAMARLLGPCEAIGFDYCQPHRIELDRAALIAAHYDAPFRVVHLPPLPLVDDVVFAGRNLVMVAHAVAHAQAGGHHTVLLGCNADDSGRFPDCRPSFLGCLHAVASAYGVAVCAPLLLSTKAQIMKTARSMGVPVDLTWSCYSPRDGAPCGDCLACRTRAGAE